MGTASTLRSITRRVFCVVAAATLATAACRSGDGDVDVDRQEAGVETAQPEAGAAAVQRSAPADGTDDPLAAAPQRLPAPMIFVSPKPGSRICLPASIDARFKLNEAMVINGRFDPNAFTVYMDGKNIMRDVEFFPSQSFPQTHVAVLHAMWVYDAGPHTARIEFVGDDGDTFYEWTFTIGSDCPPQLF
jgi:hypothetical protein